MGAFTFIGPEYWTNTTTTQSNYWVSVGDILLPNNTPKQPKKLATFCEELWHDLKDWLDVDLAY
jgi:hypothetical protein